MKKTHLKIPVFFLFAACMPHAAQADSLSTLDRLAFKQTSNTASITASTSTPIPNPNFAADNSNSKISFSNRDAEHADPTLIAELSGLKYTQHPPGFLDKYDESVWYADMDARLSKYMPHQEQRMEFLKNVREAATQSGLYPELVLAVIQIESNFQKYAVSYAGAKGYMQVMPFWLEKANVPNASLFDTKTNLAFGCTILRYYIGRAHGNWSKGLAMYNGSIGKADYPYAVMMKLQKSWRPH